MEVTDPWEGLLNKSGSLPRCCSLQLPDQASGRVKEKRGQVPESEYPPLGPRFLLRDRGAGCGQREGFKIVEGWEAGITFLPANTSPKRLRTQLKVHIQNRASSWTRGWGRDVSQQHPRENMESMPPEPTTRSRLSLAFLLKVTGSSASLELPLQRLHPENKQTIKLWKLGGVGKEQPRNHAI